MNWRRGARDASRRGEPATRSSTSHPDNPKTRRFFADNLRLLYRAHGWTQERLAAVTGIAADDLGELEREELDADIETCVRLLYGIAEEPLPVVERSASESRYALGRNVRTRRERLNYTVERVARECDEDPWHIVEVESGKARASMFLLLKLETVLETDRFDLLGIVRKQNAKGDSDMDEREVESGLEEQADRNVIRAASDQIGAAFAEYLRTLRETNDLSKDDLAEVSGVDPDALIEYECGQREPDSEACVRLVAAVDGSSSREQIEELVAEHRIKLPDNLRAFRREQGLSVEDIAYICVEDVRRVTDIEDGTALPTFVLLFKLSQALEVSVNDLVGIDRTLGP